MLSALELYEHNIAISEALFGFLHGGKRGGFDRVGKSDQPGKLRKSFQGGHQIVLPRNAGTGDIEELGHDGTPD